MIKQYLILKILQLPLPRKIVIIMKIIATITTIIIKEVQIVWIIQSMKKRIPMQIIIKTTIVIIKT